MSKDINIYQLKRIVDKHYSISQALSKKFPENEYSYNRPCFCPFHENVNTPAAVIYDNEDGEALWCHAERKIYKASDVLEQIYGFDIYELGKRLYDNMSEYEKEQYAKKDYASFFEVEVTETVDIEDKKAEQLFKERKITLEEYLKIISKHSV